jgi:Ca2+-binding RTX toxin-like protein
MTFSGGASRYNGALGTGRPADAAISPDGTRIYASGTDGSVLVYDAASGALVATWPAGSKLGALDVSPDGSFLLVLEAEPVSSFYAPTGWPDNRFTVLVYKIDTATGAVTTFTHISQGYEWGFMDVGILANGTALLTTKALPGWSAWVEPVTLNTSDGVFTTIPLLIRHNSFVSDTHGGEYALVGEFNSSGAGVRVFTAGTGFTAVNGLYENGVAGFNTGVQAISARGNLVAQHVNGNGLHIYDTALSYHVDLSDLYPGWINNIAGLAFDATGSYLFVLDTDADAIHRLAVGTWTVVDSISVGANLVGSQGGFGSRLLVAPDMRYLTVITDNGLLQIDYPAGGAIVGTPGNDILDGTASDDIIEGRGGNDTLNGHGGNDFLDGGTGADRMIGGTGNDIYIVDSAGDVVVEQADEGTDEVRTSLTVYTLANWVENLVGTSSAGQWLNGNVLSNIVKLGNGNDTVYAGAGDDSVYGNGGDDWIHGGVPQSTADAAATGSGDDRLYGGAGNDVLIGADGDDQLFGGIGHDWLDGGDGNDVLWGEDGDDTIITGRSQRMDPISGALLAGGIDIAYGGNGNDEFYADLGTSHLYGEGGNDILRFGASFDPTDIASGGVGADTMRIGGKYDDLILSGSNILDVEHLVLDKGTAGWTHHFKLTTTDSLVAAGRTFRIDANGLASAEFVDFDGSAETDGRFIVHTGAGADRIVTGAGNDYLFGHGGADYMAGGRGNDVYGVDDAGDVVVEAPDGGIDEVQTALGSRSDFAAMYILPANVEVLVGTSATGQGVYGNALDNVIMMGNGGDLIVLHDGGDDLVFASGGNDYIYYGASFTNADSNDGGAGTDTVGLLGNYTLTFDADDLVSIEALAAYSSGNPAAPNSYSLTTVDANVAAGEHLMVTGMSLSKIETLVFNGAAETDGRFTILGGRADDTITGGMGNDLIWGNLGADVLRGGGGNDSFEYYAVAESTPGARDMIMDFSAGDKVNLFSIDADGNAANGNSKFAFIGSAAFTGAAGELRAVQHATHTRAWIVEGDIDGDGQADFSLVVVTQPGYLLGAGDFIL